MPLVVHAAGLGNLKVLSALGQPLNAEIQVVAEQSDELDSISARLASPEAFARAGIEFNPVLLGMTVNLERRDGKPVLQLRTKQPVNDPFLDILVELQWSSGRLVREYTFLLDPPEYKGPQPIATTPPPAVATPIQRPAEVPAPAVPPVQEKPIAETPTPAPTATPTPAATPTETQAPTPPVTPKEQTYAVKQGDTLGDIARSHMGKGVTYNQMLIALFRANREAFIRDNINLVRAGKVLTVPGQDDVAAVDPEEAKRLVHEHMAAFAEYRRKLASAAAASKPAGESGAQQATTGLITEKPAEPAPEAPQDQLKLSKAEPGKPGSAGSVAASGDDRVARERALQEAQSRVADLEKNVSDLQKLLELKNQQLAEMEKKAAPPPAATPQAPTAAAKPPAAPQPEQAAPTPATQPSAPPAQQAAQQPAPQVSKAPEAPKPATQPAAKPRPQPKPVAPPEPSLVDELLENPMALFGIGAIVVLLLGYGAWSWRRKKSGQARFQDSVAGGALAGAAASSLINAPEQQPGGMPSQVSVSQSNLAAMEADEVDPIAEADVYMAYGRDTQAEEILKEAVQKDPNRAAVHAKLLEIYAGRRDGAAFEQTALKLKGLTNGLGPEWDKAAGLGRSLDPNNSLYGGGGSTDVAPAAVTPAPPPPPAAPTLDFDLDSTQGGGSAAAADIDFDLGSGAHETLPKEQSAFSAGGTLKMNMGKEETTTGLDFDLGGGQPKPSGGGLDFELPATGGHERAGAHAPDDTTASMNFDLHLDTEGSKAGSEVSKTQPSIDLSSISLDLGGANDDALVPATQTDPKWQEVATKLDLAKAYEDMGDKDGARELLNEVMKEGDTAQKGQAQQMLASLG